MLTKGKLSLAGILAAGILCGGLMLVTSGCGPAEQTVTEPASTNNAPPGGGSTDEYAKKMQELKGGAPGSGAPGGAPASGAPGPHK